MNLERLKNDSSKSGSGNIASNRAFQIAPFSIYSTTKPYEPWSKVVHNKGNRVAFGMCQEFTRTACENYTTGEMAVLWYHSSTSEA